MDKERIHRLRGATNTWFVSARELSVDCPSQLTFLPCICHLSRRWQAYLSDGKIFETRKFKLEIFCIHNEGRDAKIFIRNPECEDCNRTPLDYKMIQRYILMSNLNVSYLVNLCVTLLHCYSSTLRNEKWFLGHLHNPRTMQFELDPIIFYQENLANFNTQSLEDAQAG